MKQGADALALVVPDPLQQVAVEDVPEVGLWRSIAEPSAVVSVGAGCHERREVAVPGALGHFMNEPARLHPCLLGVGQFTVPDGARTTPATPSTCRNSTTVPGIEPMWPRPADAAGRAASRPASGTSLRRLNVSSPVRKGQSPPII